MLDTMVACGGPPWLLCCFTGESYLMDRLGYAGLHLGESEGIRTLRC
jgi:hypothetical protein